MPPAIHPVELIQVLQHRHLTPAIVFLTSRRACDEAIDSFRHRDVPIAPKRASAIAEVLQQMTINYPSIAHHSFLPIVQRYGVAAHHAGHLPSWKITIEELMRKGCLNAVFATTTLAAGVDFPARTVVITQSSIRKARDFTELTITEIQQLSGRGGRRGKDLVGFVMVTPSPFIDLNVIAKGLTGQPEPIDSQFVLSYPMVLNLLKAHSVDHIQPILAKSFAQFQLDQRAETLGKKREALQVKMQPFGPRLCADWISQWQRFDLSKKRRPRTQGHPEPPELVSRIPFLTPGRVVGLAKGRGVVLRQHQTRDHNQAMLTMIRERGSIAECPASQVVKIYDRVIEVMETRTFPWCTQACLDTILQELENLPSRLRSLPILIEKGDKEHPLAPENLNDKFPCPTCPDQHACRKDHSQALRIRQELHQITKTIKTLNSEMWNRFQEHVEILQRFGYLTPACQLTADGDWARLIRIEHSLLLTELIRAESFTGIDPSLLAGVLASIAYDDDRPGSFPRRSAALGSVLNQVRTMAGSLAPYEKPPLLRSDVAALGELWIGQAALPWKDLIQTTTMAEGDVYRLLSRTVEFLSQLYGLKSTHPGLADLANQTLKIMRRDVLQELP